MDASYARVLYANHRSLVIQPAVALFSTIGEFYSFFLVHGVYESRPQSAIQKVQCLERKKRKNSVLFACMQTI